MSYRTLAFIIALFIAVPCGVVMAWSVDAAHISDLSPALRVDPAQATSVEDKINAIRASLSRPARTIDDRLRSAAAACFTRADTCQDANAWLGLLAAHGYDMGAASVALGFGVSEDAVLSYWLSDVTYAHRVFKQGGSSVYEDQGCAVQGIGYGVNLVCFMASEFVPFEPLPTATPQPLVIPRVGTPHRPFPTATPRWWRP